jgi:general L-amino acid transport system permease protein
MSVHQPHPDLPPPASIVGVMGWMRQNLFSSPMNTVLTLIGAYLLYILVVPALRWAVFDADFTGSTAQDCAGTGACWVYVKVRFGQFMYGFYPEAERWRVNFGGILLIVLAAPLFFERFKHKGLLGGFLLLGYPSIAFFLFYGGVFGLQVVETRLWGGLMLTLVLASVGIVAALPLGVILALGRRSTMPIIRSLCIAFIELWRGVPLITVLFMASVMLPLFLPEGTNFDKLLRAVIGIVLFQSAYMAEVVRGGLQAIPKGQYEAAEALALNYWKSMGLIILPQALKLVIPGIVNTFIALFKDTTLVLIVGLLDLLALVHAANSDTAWLGHAVEGYVFAAGIYWIFCFSMSRYSQALEQKLHTGHRR